MKIKKNILLRGIGLLIIGGVAGYLISEYTAPQMDMAGAEEKVAGKGEPLFYRHPMNPDVTSPTPVKDEMGMD